MIDRPAGSYIETPSGELIPNTQDEAMAARAAAGGGQAPPDEPKDAGAAGTKEEVTDHVQ